MRVYFFLHHGHHVERVAHGVEAQDPRELLKTCPEGQRETVMGFRGLDRKILALRGRTKELYRFSARTFFPH